MGQYPKIWLSVDRFVLQVLQQKAGPAVAAPRTSLYSLHLLQRQFDVAPGMRLPPPPNYRKAVAAAATKKAVVTAANEMLNAVVTASKKRSSPPTTKC